MALDFLADAGPATTRRQRGRGGRGARHVAALLVGLTAVVLIPPLVAGVPWAAVADVVGAVPARAVVALVALWLLGLMAHTITLSAALPGLTGRRALLLSLTGSSVANVLPAGGAAGIALNYRMTQSWHFAPSAFATYTVLTNVWDVLAKLAAPVLVGVAFLVVGGPPAQGVAIGTLAVVVLAAAAVIVTAVVALARPTTLERLARVLDATVGMVRRIGGRPPARVVTPVQLATWRDSTAALARSRWGRLSTGMATYTALLLLLLAACLRVTGAGVPVRVLVLAFCAERLMTLIPLTPGGIGVVEIGLVALLVAAPGASAAGVSSGVLLYRALTFGLEIPVGGALLAGWLWRRRTADDDGRLP